MSMPRLKEAFAPSDPIPAAWLSEVARRLNDLRGVPPILYQDDRIALDSEWAVFAHPWQLYYSGGKLQVRAGAVYDGSDYIEVDALADAPATDTHVWLRLKYWNNPSTDTIAVIESGTAWPADDYTDDSVPTTGGTTPRDGWAEFVIRLGRCEDGEVTAQYQRSDIIWPRGDTKTETRVVGLRMLEGGAAYTTVDVTLINGVEVTTSDTTDHTLFQVGPCPDEGGAA